MPTPVRLACAVILTLAALTACSDSKPSGVPALGRVWAPNQQGYGKVRPTTIFNGGDPTGRVEEVRWESWGGERAEATGYSYIPPSNGGVAASSREKVRVYAWDLGTCRGKRAYRRITWIGASERYDDQTYINICTGGYHFSL